MRKQTTLEDTYAYNLYATSKTTSINLPRPHGATLWESQDHLPKSAAGPLKNSRSHSIDSKSPSQPSQTSHCIPLSMIGKNIHGPPTSRPDHSTMIKDTGINDNSSLRVKCTLYLLMQSRMLRRRWHVKNNIDRPVTEAH